MKTQLNDNSRITRRTLMHHASSVCMMFAIGISATGCSPTVKVQAPEKPIEINMNIKIEQEVRVRVERDLEEAFSNDPSIFGLPPAE